MTEYQLQTLLEKEGALLEQFLFIVYYTNPAQDKIRLLVDDGSIKMSVSREKFLYLFNELLQPRTFEIEKNFQRIKASLNTYGKWYYYDRIKNQFKELLELPEIEKLNPSKLFENTSMIREELNSKFKATVDEYNKEVISKAPIPKKQKTILNKFYSFFKELNHPKSK
jgi:hypothetical protein